MKKLRIKYLHVNNNLQGGTTEEEFDKIGGELLKALCFDNYDQAVVTIEDGYDIDQYTIWAGDFLTVRNICE